MIGEEDGSGVEGRAREVIGGKCGEGDEGK